MLVLPNTITMGAVLSSYRWLFDSLDEPSEPQQQETSRTATADSMSPSVTDSALPLDVLQLVVEHLPRSDHAAARLVSTTLCKLIEPSIQTLRIKDAQNFTLPGSSSSSIHHWQYVSQLEVLTTLDWHLLEVMLQRLPQLQHLRLHTLLERRMPTQLAPALTGLSRLDVGRSDVSILPGGVQLPNLQAVSFGGCYGHNIATIAAFAPNVQQLYCERLSFVASEGTVLPRCTHFGASHLYVSGGTRHLVDVRADRSVVDSLLHPLMPSLKVLYRIPEISAPAGTYPLLDVASVHTLKAIKGHGMLLTSPLLEQLQQFAHLERLCLHNPLGSGMGGFQGINTLTQLRHLRLTGTCKPPGASAAAAVQPQSALTSVIKQIQQLPCLHSLALPCELLCADCCPGVKHSLMLLCGNNMLKQLVFLQLKHAGPTMEKPHRRFRGCECPHKEIWKASIAELSVANAAGGADSQLCVTLQVGEVWPDHFPWMNNDDHGRLEGVCCVYGPNGEW